MHYKKEIPYAVEIETEEFFEDEKIIKIRAIIMVERETQKGIIIGHKGSAALKRVGMEARKDLETVLRQKNILGPVRQSQQKLEKRLQATASFWIQ